MKKLHFIYEMKIDYSNEVNRCNFTIKCIPQNTERQKIDNIKIDMFPTDNYSVGTDGLGNTKIYGTDLVPHTLFSFRIEGDAETGLAVHEAEADEQAVLFAYPHGMNAPGKGICSYYETIRPADDLGVREKASVMMHRLHQDFRYEPMTTNVDTTAEEAYVQGCGVCQDYAHIFIALLHQAGIPARYVTGFIVGEGASHAWVELLDDGLWYGYDPTHDCPVDDNYIRIGVGRDAKDCVINKGYLHGGGLQTQTVSVSVAEIE